MALKRELIYIDGKDETDRIEKYSYKANRCVIVFKNSNREFAYSKNRAKIIKTAVSNDNAFEVFKYLKEIEDAIGLKSETGKNILAKSYESIYTIPEKSVLSNFIKANLSPGNYDSSDPKYFPFGFNLSQKQAVSNGLSKKLSVIEGPPGTGKTQTILNIIANAISNNQTVAVVSSNNSATENVYEKLEKNGLSFIAALLGSSKKKQAFIESQKQVPDLSQFNLSIKKENYLKDNIANLLTQISENQDNKNELALLKLEIDQFKTEFRHFKDTYQDKIIEPLNFRKSISAEKILKLWVSLDAYAEKENKPGFFKRLLYRFKYGLKEESFRTHTLDEMIINCQFNYYDAKIKELDKRIDHSQQFLKNFSFDEKMKTYTNYCMFLLKAELHKRYRKQTRKIYSINELRQKSEEFIKDYPVIMSTTYSLKRALSHNILYDYVIIDEASQVDLATGVLALSCAKQAIIVGDVKQLPNVVNEDVQRKTDMIFDSYKLKEAYRYSNHSLLSSLLELLPEIPKTLLREHYRCHPKIIEFCNQKFYNNQLIVHTTNKNKRQPLKVYKTVEGNHARELMNQRQIDVIKQEIITNEKLDLVDLGIVTPYRKQSDALKQAFTGNTIKADTVNKFQGRENEVIILSTVDNEISDFTDNENRINVAVSRAVDQLIVVIHGNDNKKDGHITDLINYIRYNNFDTIYSELNSVFDLLYKCYD
ncbi:AAA domain-containing protein [Zunongwangia endophytica]|uniref:AAA domain-containing protein n=1 Tax=Zunongwangia endophytica TaxID=1808945 RepID=A0ABV8HFP9_9FLAO|nr:AAA domain-containing protein [Zunongwangia endophytica]MDN3594135.1 AAA domain-containing protein [Zunongwangia endophytica]